MTPEIETSTEAHKTGHQWIDLSVAICALGALKSRACFCSVFDECWITDMRTLHPEAVEECLQPSVQFVQ